MATVFAASPTQQYRVRTAQIPQEEGGGGSSIAWILIIILAVLIIAGLIVWLIFALRHNKDDRRIDLTNANVEVTSPTSIKGTWAQTSSTEDKITLYATLDPPEYNANGTLNNANIAGKNDVTGGGTSVPVDKLQPGLKYYATLIVTNNGTSNYATYTQLVYMEAGQPVSEFRIEDIIQIGQISRVDGSDTQVEFTQDISADESLWELNNSGQLVPVSEDTLCLTVDSNDLLVLAECNTLSTNDKWTYNHDGLANRWCLTNTLSNTNPRCMELEPINQTGRTANVKISDQTNAGDAWVNVIPLLQII